MDLASESMNQRKTLRGGELRAREEENMRGQPLRHPDTQTPRRPDTQTPKHKVSQRQRCKERYTEVRKIKSQMENVYGII